MTTQTTDTKASCAEPPRNMNQEGLGTPMAVKGQRIPIRQQIEQRISNISSDMQLHVSKMEDIQIILDMLPAKMTFEQEMAVDRVINRTL